MKCQIVLKNAGVHKKILIMFAQVLLKILKCPLIDVPNKFQIKIRSPNFCQSVIENSIKMEKICESEGGFSHINSTNNSFFMNNEYLICVL